jgi:dihydroorotate dehydrogenase (NAD+) catalytic subunit
MAHAVEQAGADAISLVNTFLGMRIDLKTARPIISIKKGGYSGPGIYPIALRMVYEVSHAVNVPVIGMGGVSNAYQVLEMMYAGASLVMIGAENLVDPCACKKIIEDLPKVMKEYNIENLEDIIGRCK